MSATVAGLVQLTPLLGTSTQAWHDLVAYEVKLAARRLGVLSTYADTAPGWRIYDMSGLRWRVWRSFKTGCDVDTPTAALFLLLLGLPEVAVICPDCLAKRYQEQGLKASVSVWLSGPGWHWWAAGLCWRRKCPTCTVDGAPTGKVTREPARLLLDAMPRTVTSLDSKAPPMHTVIETVVPADPVARERLAVLADELQASGNPRGEWLALWLRGAVETEAGHTMPIDTALPAIAVALRDLQ